MEGGTAAHRRTSRFVLAEAERRVLVALARRLPASVVPDHMTLVGVAGALGVGISYLLTNRAPGYLLAASAFLLVQWLGDSLDGMLARVRSVERPRYGFYVDHLVDALSTAVIGVGLGHSPYMLLSVGLGIVIVYLALSINVYLETHVYGEFSVAYGGVGPTEARIALIALNLGALAFGPLPFRVLGVELTAFDVAGGVALLVMAGLLGARIAANLRRLGRLEPPPSPSPADGDGTAAS